MNEREARGRLGCGVENLLWQPRLAELMAKKYSAKISGYRLRGEITARFVANDLVNRGGPSFFSLL